LRRIHYAWIVAAVTFIALMGAAGFRATPGVLIVPLQNEFGWNRAVISIAVSINLILFGLTGPFAAALMDRFGIRAVTVGALLTVAAGALLTTIMTSPWQLYLLWGVVVGLGTGCMASVLAATVAGRWFVHRRGLVLGALTAAGATGQLIFLPALGWMAQNLGWRVAAVTVGLAALVVVPLVAIFLRNRPSDLGLRAYGATEADTMPFKPADKEVNGGGSYVLFDFAKPNPKPLVATGRWKARRFVSYDKRNLGSYGTIQPGILEMKADVEGIGKNLTLAVVCNVGAVPLNTGEEEGWELSGTPYGTFKQLSPPLGLSRLSVEGFRIGGD